MEVRVLTLFPERIQSYFQEGIPRRALEEGHSVARQKIFATIRRINTEKLMIIHMVKGPAWCFLPNRSDARHDSGYIVHLLRGESPDTEESAGTGRKRVDPHLFPL